MILTDNNIVAFIGNIEKGVYPEADGSCELYKITNGEGVFYAVTGFVLHDVDAPAEVEPIKWCYTEEEGFYLNPDYNEMDMLYSPDYQEGYQQAILDMMEVH